jgi:hypothetical protein
MLRAKALVLTLSLLFSGLIFAQGEAAIPFLLLPVSPEQTSMGAAGTSLPTDDPYGFLMNPAQLGYTSLTNNFSIMLQPEIDWLNWRGLKLNSMGVNLGYNFKKLTGIPLSLGAGFANPEINFGQFVITNEEGEVIGYKDDKDQYTAWSVGAGVDYYVQFSAGITYKDILSDLGQYSAKTNTLDYGFLLNVPVGKLIYSDENFNLLTNVPVIPFLNISFGYALQNIGDEVYYIDPAQKDPLPRTARTGYGISAGMDFKFEHSQLNVFDLSFTVDADDILITRDANGIEYQSGFGDIDYYKHVIEIRGDDKVVTHSGLQFSLLETVILRNGHLSGRGYDTRTTNGLELRAKGLLKLLSRFSGDPTMDFISRHFDLRYYSAEYFSDHQFETDITGFALVVSGFEF